MNTNQVSIKNLGTVHEETPTDYLNNLEPNTLQDDLLVLENVKNTKRSNRRRTRNRKLPKTKKYNTPDDTWEPGDPINLGLEDTIKPRVKSRRDIRIERRELARLEESLVIINKKPDPPSYGFFKWLSSLFY